MITQAIKRWLYKLFSWWPWKSAPSTGFSPSLTNANMGSAQETVWRTTLEGPLPQAGMMSVAVEQDEDDAIPDPSWLSSEIRPERLVQPSSPTSAELNNSNSNSDPDLSHLSSADIPSTSTGDAPSPTFEQQLAFLQYLVKRGMVNEGFSEGQVPKQYRRKYEREV
jgi:hypothetical protein